MRFLLSLAAVLLVVALAWKATGHALPFVDFGVGPLGAPLVQPQIQIQAPGYNPNLP